MLFICYPKCSTCKKAKKFLTDHQIEFDERHIVEEKLNKDELKALYLKSGLPLKRFFNTSGNLYKEKHLKDVLPTLSEDEQLGERIFNETELNSRLEVELEKYTMKVQIEGRVLGDLAINHIVPTAVAYQNRLLENLRGLKEIFPAEEYEVLSADRKELIREISHRVTSIKVLVREMTEARKVANHMENYKERAFAYEEKVRPYLDQIRDHIDHLEMEVDDEIWPLPKYRELLFTK